MKIFLGRLFLWVMAWVPWRARSALAGGVAGLVRMSGWRKLERIDANLERALPEIDDRERARLVRANVQAMLLTAFECGPIWHREPAWIRERIVQVDGREHVDQALGRGRGVLVLGGHLGNWELSILYGSLTLPIDYLYKPPRSARVDRLLTRYRARFDARMIPTGGAAMRRAVRKLRGGGALGMLFDQLPRGGEFVPAPFFGRDVATMTLPHRLVGATGCAVVMGHCLRLPDRRAWKIRFDPVPGADDADPVRAAASMNAVLEQVVREAPEQYLWHYRRFERLEPRARRPAA